MEKIQNEILRRLDVIIKLLTIDVMKDKTQRDKIMLLNGAGFGPKQISEIIGTSSNTVNVALSNLRKKQKKEDNNQNQKNLESVQDAEEELNLGENNNGN